MEQNIAFVLSLVCMVGFASVAGIWRRRMLAYRDALNALRRNCFLTNERGHRVRYENAAPDLQAMAER